MFWSTRKIIISTGHELHHPHYAHFYCYFSHRFGIRRVKSMLAKTGRNLTILIFQPKLIVFTPFLTFFHFKCLQPNLTLKYITTLQNLFQNAILNSISTKYEIAILLKIILLNEILMYM